MLCCTVSLPSPSRWSICSCAKEKALLCRGSLNQKGSGGTLLWGTIPGAQPGWLTVRCPRSEVVGCLCHVLRQQLPVGDPGGHLAVQFLVEEFFYSGTWNKDTTSGYRRKVKEGPAEPAFTVSHSPQSCTGQQRAALGEMSPP